MRTTALLLATALVAVAVVALAPSASAEGCEITQPRCIPDWLLGQERCIENVPPHGHDLCWGP